MVDWLELLILSLRNLRGTRYFGPPSRTERASCKEQTAVIDAVTLRDPLAAS